LRRLQNQEVPTHRSRQKPFDRDTSAAVPNGKQSGLFRHGQPTWWNERKSLRHFCGK
jgi:hypothetical protein